MKIKKTPKKRRAQAKTDYLKRLKLLKSEKPRLVFRRTNKFVIVQYVTSYEAKDSIVFGITSKELVNYGWDAKASNSLKSISACYLTGYLIAKQIISKKLEQPIIDFGMLQTLYKTKIFGFVKGVIDGGINISCKEEAFPEEARIKGENLKNKINFEQIKKNIDSNPFIKEKKGGKK